MKMAKATEKDLEASLELCRALEALENGYLPLEMEASKGCESEIEYDPRQHAGQVVEYLLGIQKRASLFRVCFGMTVLLDPQNELVDPESSTLEAHPKFEKVAMQRNRLLSAIKACDLSDFPGIRNIAAEVEGKDGLDALTPEAHAERHPAP